MDKKVDENSLLIDPKNLAIHDYQKELTEELYAETQVDPDQFNHWEHHFVMSCYSLMKTTAEDWCLTQTQQERLEALFNKIHGGDD